VNEEDPVVCLSDRGDWHISRHWSATDLEDACPCPKKACGMVPLDQVAPECQEHPSTRGKTIRRAHLPEDCWLHQRTQRGHSSRGSWRGFWEGVKRELRHLDDWLPD